MIEMVSSHGGMNYYDFGLMMGLGKLEHDVTLYTSEPLLFDITSNKNLKVNLAYKGLFETKNKFIKLFHYMKGTFTALNDSRKRKVKIVHFQIFAITYLESFVVWLTKKMGFKLIVTIHDVESFNKQNRKKLSTFFYNNVDKKEHFKTAQDMMKFCQIDNFTPYLLENAMDDNLYATTFYGIFTNPQTKKSKFIVAIGQKEDIVSKTSDWLLIDFKEEFNFYLGYSISFGHYGPYLDNYKGETHINSLTPNNFSSYQSNHVYKFLFTLTFNYLNQLLSQ